MCSCVISFNFNSCINFTNLHKNAIKTRTFHKHCTFLSWTTSGQTQMLPLYDYQLANTITIWLLSNKHVFFFFLFQKKNDGISSYQCEFFFFQLSGCCSNFPYLNAIYKLSLNTQGSLAIRPQYFFKWTPKWYQNPNTKTRRLKLFLK